MGDANILKNIGKMLSSPAISTTSLNSILTDANMPATSRSVIYAYMEGSAVKASLDARSLTANQYQSELYAIVDAGAYDTVIGVITAGASSLTVTTNTTLTTGVNRYGMLSIDPGVTLTLGAEPGVIIADTVRNLGTITSGWIKGAGGAPGASGAGAGGGGAGAIIILARMITVGTITADGAAGGAGSTVAASGNGGAGGAGNFWLIFGDSVGLGGNGGVTGAGAGNRNGGGGGGGSAYLGGAGGAATTTTFSSGLSLLNRLMKAACDWWLVNVAAKTPTSTISLPSLGGSGGGGGAAYDANSASGGGGGGGGQIIIYGTNMDAGVVSAKGGAGGSGGTEGTYDGGGGGGGGGVIYVFYKNLTGSFAFFVSGGSGGSGDTAGSSGTTGASKTITV
jgi:hypothetical protein